MKYAVYAVYQASYYVGEYEAESAEEAENKAWPDVHFSLCHQCSDLELGDPDRLEVEPVE